MAGRGSFRKRSYRGRGHHGRSYERSLPATPTPPPSNRSSIPPNPMTSFKRSGQTSGSSFRPSSSNAITSVAGDMGFSSCQKVGRVMKDCWHRNGQCLRCGSHDHKIATCPIPATDRSTRLLR